MLTELLIGNLISIILGSVMWVYANKQINNNMETSPHKMILLISDSVSTLIRATVKIIPIWLLISLLAIVVAVAIAMPSIKSSILFVLSCLMALAAIVSSKIVAR
ncbi:MAG: hypothetical protein DM484_25920 [Candidatus Methylumidiphilus alinenensis]|uniref:Uncharacterized protein n=1 Tax=Candidatus Methylumidiphilus alinenensis TaxID=2202197 RepID=A0A2W4QMN2_9GAMM|nr:MAG: hypothetical protein DM484_25920 [Candidatus Methylumidiphilus alinenensis]